MQQGGKFVFGWEVDAFTENEHVIISENFLLLVTLVCGCFILQHMVGSVWKVQNLPECLATVFLSVVVSGCIGLAVERRSHFSPLILGFSSEIFYFGLLPPIIFNSAYHLRRKLLYGNLGAVFTLAFVGTCLSAAITSLGIRMLQLALPNSPDLSLMERAAFACVVAASDPISTLAVFARLRVDPTLYYAVLGESVLNDAVAITAFRVAARMISASTVTTLDIVALAVNFVVIVIGSSVIGYLVAVLVAVVLRHVEFGHHKLAPVAVMICTLYIPFFLAETLQLSGIVTVFFSGIAARRYVHKNLGLGVRKIAGYTFHLLSHASETTCFALMGLSVFLMDFPMEQWGFMLGVLALCLVSRPMAVYPLLGLLNAYRIMRHPPPSFPMSAGEVHLPDISAMNDSRDTSSNGSSDSKSVTSDGGQYSVDFVDLEQHVQSPFSPFSNEESTPSGPHTPPGPAPQLPTQAHRDAGPQAPASEALPLTEPLSWANMHVIAFVGMRGAVSYALAYDFPDTHGNRNLVMCTTILVVLATTIVQGTLTEPLIRWLGVKIGVDMAEYVQQRTPAQKGQSELEKWLLYPFVVKPRHGAYQSVEHTPAQEQPNAHQSPTGKGTCLCTQRWQDVAEESWSSGGGSIVSGDVEHRCSPPSKALHRPPSLHSLRESTGRVHTDRLLHHRAHSTTALSANYPGQTRTAVGRSSSTSQRSVARSSARESRRHRLPYRLVIDSRACDSAEASTVPALHQRNAIVLNHLAFPQLFCDELERQLALHALSVRHAEGAHYGHGHGEAAGPVGAAIASDQGGGENGEDDV